MTNTIAYDQQSSGTVDVERCPWDGAKRHRLQVLSVQKWTDDIHGLTLGPGRDGLPSFHPGHYALLEFPDGLSRPLSIASSPSTFRLDFHVKHFAGSQFTRRITEELAVGDPVTVAAPFGNAWLRNDQVRPISLVAGGTGLAPAKAIIEHLAHTDDSRTLRLYWGVRRHRELYASSLLDSLMQQHRDFKWQPVLMEPSEGWKGASGLVHETALRFCDSPAMQDIYLSGPPAMLKAAAAAFRKAGAHPDHLFHDPW